MSSSLACGRQAPTALTWVPGASQSRCSTGTGELVAVTTMPAPATASRALSQAVMTGIWPARAFPGPVSRPGAVPASGAARPGPDPAILTSARGRLAAIARRCDLAWTPVPMIASTSASGLARASVATAETAAVLISVTAEAFSTASGSPVCGLDSSTTPWWLSRPAAGLPGMMQIALSPNAASWPGW